MLLKNLQASWRYLRHNPLFALINVVGLVIGITSALFIFIYVSFESSYDRFHPDSERIYRVLGIDSALGLTSNNVGIVMPALGPAMEELIPEVEQTVRINRRGAGAFVSMDDRNYFAQGVVLTEDAFFEVFNFPFVQRQSGVLLDKPHSAVLTEEFAERVFGPGDQLGKLFRFENQDIEVVGVVENPPPDSHMKFDMLVSLNYLAPDEEGAQQIRTFLDNWGTIAMITYARLAPGASEAAVEERLTALLAERSVMKTFSATLQPLQDAHLDSAGVIFDDYNANKGDAQKLVMLSSVALFLLLIAAFNFMNLSTARATLRAKEVGVRKSAGATRAELVRQFLLESLLLVGIATLLGIVLLWVLEPVVSLPLAEGFVSYLFSHRQTVVISAIGLVLVGLLAGSYPAFVLSSFQPATVLKGKFANSARGLWLRRVLVVLQFALSIAIIIGMLVVSRQLEYMREKDPGFERDGIVNIALTDPRMTANYEALKNELLALPQVLGVGGSSNMPGQTFGRGGLRLPGGGTDELFMMSMLGVDNAYFDTLSMNLIEGRGYSQEYPNDVAESIILNESAARALGWEGDAVGKSVQLGPNPRTVIGVVRDFHFANMRHQIEPVAMMAQNPNQPPRMLSIRIDRNAPREAIEGIRAVWEELNPAFPFTYTFFTDEYNRLFSADEEFSAMLYQFTFVAIVIACLGLYGLASFSADQKTKEIGIRKVMGATTGSLLKLVLKEYAALMLVANLLAWAAAWFVMQQWLMGFAYRTELPLSSFAIATLGTALLALATVCREIYKVVLTKPVESLRYE